MRALIMRAWCALLAVGLLLDGPAWADTRGTQALGTVTALQKTLLPTRRAVLTNGGQGDNVPQTLQQIGFRLVLKLPVSSIRWRLKLRNYNSRVVGSQVDLTLLGASIGAHAPGSLGIETGNYSGAVTQLVGAGATLPGNGSFFYSPWFTAPSAQMIANKEYVLGLAWTAAASGTIVTGTGQNFQFTTPADALDATKTGGAVKGTIPLDVQIEYECQTARKIILFVTDSIGVGYGGGTRFNTLYQNYPSLWAFRNNAIAVVIGQSGSTTFDWQKPPPEDRWSRVDIASIAPDGFVVALGANDAINNSNLGTYQSYMAATVANATSLVPNKPYYLVNITPRGLSGTQETFRTDSNSWLSQVPLGANGVADLDAIARDPAAPTNLLTAYQFDQTHPNRAGSNAYAGVAKSTFGF